MPIYAREAGETWVIEPGDDVLLADPDGVQTAAFVLAANDRLRFDDDADHDFGWEVVRAAADPDAISVEYLVLQASAGALPDGPLGYTLRVSPASGGLIGLATRCVGTLRRQHAGVAQDELLVFVIVDP